MLDTDCTAHGGENKNRGELCSVPAAESPRSGLSRYYYKYETELYGNSLAPPSRKLQMTLPKPLKKSRKHLDRSGGCGGTGMSSPAGA